MMQALAIKRFECWSGWFNPEFEHELTLPEVVSLITAYSGRAYFSNGGVRTSRGSFFFHEIKPGLRCLFRQFRRGGAVGKLIKGTFFRCPGLNYRSVKELEAAVQLLKAGVNVPRPVVALVKHESLCSYQAHIVYEEVPLSWNFLEILANNAQSEVHAGVAFRAGREAKKMLEAGVLHKDLHPGNVLVAEGSKAYLIDFDKAFCFSPTERLLQAHSKMLIARWNRSVDKHKIGESIKRSFSEGLYNK